MPDWSYHTLFKPLLFRQPAQTARKITLSLVRGLHALPGGAHVLEFFGQMRPDPSLKRTVWGVEWDSPVGLAALIDPELESMEALAKFGAGFVQVGPFADHATSGQQEVRLDRVEEIIEYASHMQGWAAEEVIGPLEDLREQGVPLVVHVREGEHLQGQDHLQDLIFLQNQNHTQVMERLQQVANVFVFEGSVDAYFTAKEAFPSHSILFYRNGTSEEALPSPDLLAKMDGVYLDEAMPFDGGVRYGRAAKAGVIGSLRQLKQTIPSLPVMAGGGIYEPQDALDLLEAGAELVIVNTGLVFSGPGLPKRINEAILDEEQSVAPADLVEAPTTNRGWASWFLMGLGVFFAGWVALFVGLHDVILPYDEAFLGISKRAIMQWNMHVFHFMSHDRITLSGIMISAGFLFMQLAYHKVRRGERWAIRIFKVAALYGFLNFFYFLFNGYFDRLHLLYNALILPFFLVGWYLSNRSITRPTVSSNRLNSPAWKRGQWGQLMFIALGGALLVAGIVISIIGMSTVFVPQDLTYMDVSRAQIELFNSHLVTLIAHDRAGFGGALITEGLLLLLLSLWGYREGERWLWWSYLIGGAAGLAAGIGVHLRIHYTDTFHLLPAYIALALYLIGLVFSYPYLWAKKEPLP